MLNIAESFGYTEQELNYLYNIGAQKCQIGDFKGALSIFQFLHMFNSENYLYSKAIAGCFHGLEDYKSAIFYYNYTYETLPERLNYDCLFYMAKCYFKLNDNLNAKNSLSKFLDLVVMDKVAEDTFSKLIKKARILLKSMSVNPEVK